MDIFNLPLERKQSNDTGCNQFVVIIYYYLYTPCVEISGYGSENRSSERPKLALVQLITFGIANEMQLSLAIPNPSVP